MKTLECENTNCKKKLRKVSLNCLKCNFKYCSEKCLDVHKLSSCQDESSLEDESIDCRNSKLNSVERSRFIKSGTFLKILEISPLFDFENFDIVIQDDMPLIIGEGLYGDLYLAKNVNNEKLYCIKRMLKSRIEEENVSFDIIYNEINTHLKLVHDNIIRLHSFSESEDAFNLIMDYAPNGTLSSLIKNSNGLDERNAFKYFIQISSAVSFLHENNLVHRDIKPENILLDENFNVKICDFGWCAELSQGNRLTFCGTYEYMAPELIDEMPYNNSIDVWALGVLLFELTQGFSPFSSENDDYMDIIKKVKNNNIIFEKPISSECEDIIRKLLSHDKNKRLKIKDVFNHPWTLYFQNELFHDKKVIRASDSTKPTSTVSRFSSDNYNRNCLETETKSVYRGSKFDISNISKITFDNNNDVISIHKDINDLLFRKSKLDNANEKKIYKRKLIDKEKRNFEDEQYNQNRNARDSIQFNTNKKGNNFNLMDEICNEVNKYEKAEVYQRSDKNQIFNKINEKPKKLSLGLLNYPEDRIDNNFLNDFGKINIKSKNDKNKKNEKNLNNLEEDITDKQDQIKLNFSKVNYTSNSNPMKSNVIVDFEKFKKTLKKEEKEKNKRQFITALNILEKAEDSKSVVHRKEIENRNNNGGFWSFLNPFKCGLD